MTAHFEMFPMQVIGLAHPVKRASDHKLTLWICFITTELSRDDLRRLNLSKIYYQLNVCRWLLGRYLQKIKKYAPKVF